MPSVETCSSPAELKKLFDQALATLCPLVEEVSLAYLGLEKSFRVGVIHDKVDRITGAGHHDIFYDEILPEELSFPITFKIYHLVSDGNTVTGYAIEHKAGTRRDELNSYNEYVGEAIKLAHDECRKDIRRGITTLEVPHLAMILDAWNLKT